MRADRVRTWLLGLWSGLALLYLFIPIFIIVLFSFNDNQGRFNFTWQGFTLRHWQDPFANPDLAKALENSLLIALVSTLIATALGTFMAMALVRYGFRGRRTVDFFVFLPLATPEVVLGAALLALFLTMNLNTGFVTIVIAHVMFTVSYVVVTVRPAWRGWTATSRRRRWTSGRRSGRRSARSPCRSSPRAWARPRCWRRRSRSTTT
jgi:spermidine/putrescine transport system permease protein